jgi:hypothetical protein
MAQKYRKIDPRMWDDEKFIALNHAGKLIAIYAITAQSNRCGIFVFSMARASEHLQIQAPTLLIAMRKLCSGLNWKFHEPSRVLYLPTWWKYNPPENEKHLFGCLKDIHDVPSSPLLSMFWNNETHLPAMSVAGFRTRKPDSYRIATPYQEQEQEQEQEQNISSPALPAQGERNDEEISPKRAPHRPNRSTNAAAVDAIYRAYPRHVAPTPAKAAIAKALAMLAKRPGIDHPETWLLERTEIYAKSREELARFDASQEKYIPYPQKWFNQARWDEDPQSWFPKGKSYASHRNRQAVVRAGEFASTVPSGGRKLGHEPQPPSDGDGGGVHSVSADPAGTDAI